MFGVWLNQLARPEIILSRVKCMSVSVLLPKSLSENMSETKSIKLIYFPLFTEKMSETKSIKLIYFDVKGLGEILRLILTYAGKEFEDVRLARETWPEVKPTTPFGQVPVLEIDGKQYGQSVALANYLAREFGLYGKSNLEALTIDTVYQLTVDLMHAYVKVLRETDPVKKEEIRKEIQTEVGPKFLGFYEKLLQENGTGYFVGDSITLADLVLYDVCSGMLKEAVGDFIADFPLVKKLVDTIGENERIKKYVSEKN
ncbi:Glutathione S-transferase 1 [Bulinus truncatus]|nr:Glutathione S-transferase 1 [Bulinus truncatus]